MLFDLGAIVMIGLFGFIGLRRGALPTVFTLVGTLIGTVLVDLWRDGVINLLARIGLAAGWPLFLSLSALLALALCVGYWIDIIVELGLEDAKEWSHRLTGVAIGVVNAALILTYLVKYAQLAWSEAEVTAQIATATVVPLVVEWLPWGMLALTLLGLFVLMFRVIHRYRTEQNLYVELPRSSREADQRVLEHINQAFERQRQ
ncbi:MAG: CvpA family protein [Chloroflexus sp.]